jgi:hypothetical protein
VRQRPVAPAKQAAAFADANETVKVTFELEKAVYKKLSRLALDRGHERPRGHHRGDPGLSGKIAVAAVR